MSSSDTTKNLLTTLTGSVTIIDPRSRRRGLDKIVFFVAAALAVAFVVWGIVSPHGLGEVANAALTGTMTNLGWLFVIAAAVFTIFVLVIALGRFGRIPLGADSDRPEFKTISWIAMMFATGMGIGLVFYGVAEPLFYYLVPPPGTVAGQTSAAISVAMGTTLFHWTLFPWAMYAIVGLGVAYGTYRLGRSTLFSSLFTSLFGAKVVNGWVGRVINILAILATLFGSACSLGLGALQIGGGIQASGFLESVDTMVLVIIIAVLTAAFVASAVSGVEKGIQWLSNINMYLALLLAVIVFIGGPTLFILNVIPDAIGAFFADLPDMASRTANDADTAAWMSSWTIFYWAWWISWTPFVGLFIARISKGRTIRQFVAGVLLAPSLVSMVWFAIFGGGAIGLQREATESGNTAGMIAPLVDGEPTVNFDMALFNLLEALPVPGWVLLFLIVLAVILIGIFFVTGADSASIVMGMLSENGTEEPTRKTVIFWGVAVGAVAAVMLLAGGDIPAEALTGLRNITIVSSVPFVLVMLLLCVSIWRDLSRDPLVLRRDLGQHLLADSVQTGVAEYGGQPFRLQTEAEAPLDTGAAAAKAAGRRAKGGNSRG